MCIVGCKDKGFLHMLQYLKIRVLSASLQIIITLNDDKAFCFVRQDDGLSRAESIKKVKTEQPVAGICHYLYNFALSLTADNQCQAASVFCLFNHS